MSQYMTKHVKCPSCGNTTTVQGSPGEKKIIVCSQCGIEGYFQFKDEKKADSPVGSQPDETVIEVRNLTKSYKDVMAVENISFQVKRGEIFGFLGPNGAGKTTTIRVLFGFLKQDSGEAYVYGKNINDNIVDVRRMVGYIPGELNLYEHLTGNQCLQYFSNIRNTDLSLLDELLDIFDLPLDRKIKTYSRGMKQKLGIVQAFMDDPEIVIMDEPTSGLDPLLQQRFYKFLKDEKKKGRTMFFSSHILSEVDKVCDRVAIIRKGKIVALENIETLKKKKGKKIRLKIKEDPEKLLSFHDGKFVDGWVEFVIEEDIDALIKKIAEFTVVDMMVSEFSLEDIFMRYYDEEGNA